MRRQGFSTMMLATAVLVAGCCLAVPSSAVQPGAAAAAKGKCAKGKKGAAAAKGKRGCKKAKKKQPVPQPTPIPTPVGPPIQVQSESLALTSYQPQGAGQDSIQGELFSDPRCASGRTISLFEDQVGADTLVTTVQLVASTNFEFVFPEPDIGDDFYAVATASTYCSGAVSNTISKP